jgi:hypothetical protein
MEYYPDISNIGYEIELEATTEDGGERKQKEDTKGKKAGVSAQEVDVLQDIMLKDPELQSSLEQLISNGKAKGTLINYNAAQARFQEFCQEKDYSYYEITEQAVIHYVADLNKQEVSYSTLCQVKPAIVMMEEMFMGKATAFTSRADRLLEGAKRLAAERRQLVKKATAVSLGLLQRAVSMYITPHVQQIHGADVFKLRTIFRLVVEYFTFCRCSDFRKLQARHVRKVGDTVEFIFPSSKNDQLHEGQVTVVTANSTELCPVKITELYFSRFGYRWDFGYRWGQEGGDERFLHARIRKTGGRHVIDGQTAASLSKAREELKRLLRDMGEESRGVTDESFKMLGVTGTLEAGTSAEEVALHGRWRSTDMPLRYKHNSQAFKSKRLRKYRIEQAVFCFRKMIRERDTKDIHR